MGFKLFMPDGCTTRTWLLFVLVLSVLTWSRASAEPPVEPVPMLNLTAGQVGVFDNIDDPYRVGLEYRFRPLGRWQLIPAIGAAVAQNDASFVYVDLRHDFWLGARWALIPSFGVGLFNDGDGLELGQTVEFRSGIELAYRFHEQWRVGLALFHLSNGGLSDTNPGTEAVVLSLSIPLRGR
ncbi:MAG: acyloxyacyl hydrolase [Gammaproteobacteria bacterium]